MNEEENKPHRSSNLSVALNNLGCVLLFMIGCATITLIFMTLAGVFS